MQPPETSNESTASRGPQPIVTVRYWAAARAAAGRPDDAVAAATVGQALDAVRVLHAGNPRLAAVLSVSSLLLGDRPLGTTDPGGVTVAPGDVIEVLPPFAGG